MIRFEDLSKDDLLGVLDDFAKNWLAHDGLWFQAVETSYDLMVAIDADREAWRRFSAIEARRIMKRHNIPPRSGLDGLKQALHLRMYARLNQQQIYDETDRSFCFKMLDCRVQSARKRQGLPDFPCKSVGVVEYTVFAQTIDDRIQTECICCPPDMHPEGHYCAWKFRLYSDLENSLAKDDR